MNRIELSNVGKKFGTHWIFKNINISFEQNNHTVILGGNGSGKSTLLQVIAGIISPTAGTICYTINDKKIDVLNWYKNISIATPYLDLPDEFSATEILSFHIKFKPLINNLSTEEFLKICYLDEAIEKPIKYFSSGMKQRLKLALAILSETECLLLDEPCSNLDAKAMEWYSETVCNYSKNRIVIVCSNNQESEFSFCKREIRVG